MKNNVVYRNLELIADETSFFSVDRSTSTESLSFFEFLNKEINFLCKNINTYVTYIS